MSNPATSESTQRLPRAVIALAAVSFLTDASGEMIMPLLPQFLVLMGAGALFLGVLEGAADTTASLLKLLSGVWADRVTAKKPLVVFGYGISSVARSFIWLSTAPWHVLGLRLTDRIGKGIRTSPRDALLSSAVSPEIRGRAFGFHRAADHAGAVVGPLLAMLLLWLGWPLSWVFAAAAVPALGAMIALIFFLPNARLEAKPKPEAVSAPLSTPFKRFLVVAGLFALGNSPDALLLLRVHELGLAPHLIPLLWAVFHVVKSALSTPFGALSDRIGRRRVLLGGFAIYSLSYGLFAVAPGPGWFCAIFLLYGCYYAMTEGVAGALVADLSTPETRGRAFGLYHATLGLCALPAGLLTGYLWTAASPAVALGLGALLSGLAALLFLVWLGRK